MFLLQQTQRSQIKRVIDCHKKCFPLSLSSQLGSNYLQKSFEWFLTGENRFLFHIIENDTVVAYCGGFTPSFKGDGSTSGMIQHAMKEAVIGMIKRPFLIVNKEVIPFYPLLIKNLFKKLFFKKNMNNQSYFVDTKEKKIGLVVIGVNPDYRGKGYFQALMSQFEKECRYRGAAKSTLSVRSTNKRAIAAYKKVGWKISWEGSTEIKMFKILAS